MSNPKRVGEGTYGCVHNPPLKCRDQLYNQDLSLIHISEPTRPY